MKKVYLSQISVPTEFHTPVIGKPKNGNEAIITLKNMKAALRLTLKNNRFL